MKIGILGAGAIGCFVGGRLISAGHDVTMVGRLGEEIAKHGLLLTDYAGGREAIPSEKIRYFADVAVLAGVEVVLVTVKSMATESAAAPLAPILAKGTTVVSLQNGVSNAARLREVLPEMRVLAGMVPFNVARPAPGHFHNGTSGALVVENLADAPIVAALRSARFDVEHRRDVDAVLWTKLLINLNNAVNALAGIPLLEQLHDRQYRRVMAACIREGLTVMRAAKIKPVRLGRLVPSLAPLILSAPNPIFLRVAAAMVKVDPLATSSMQDDLQRGRTTEIDYLNGEVVAKGRELGIATPANAAIVALVKAAETARAGSPRLPAPRLLASIATSP